MALIEYNQSTDSWCESAMLNAEPGANHADQVDFNNSSNSVHFGKFRLIDDSQQLLFGEVPVRLGSRAFVLLSFLARRHGQTIDKRDLVALAWPGLQVEQVNLRVQVAGIRRALSRHVPSAGEYIKNVPGRGYAFVEPVTLSRHRAEAPARWDQVRCRQIPGLVGRDDVIENLLAIVRRRQVVSLVGPGGIGKTTVATAVARLSESQYRDGTCFIDLASISDPSIVDGVVRAAIRGKENAGEQEPRLFATRDMLVILDNCEHLIDATALVVDDIVRQAPGIRLLATSREPLRIKGEWVHRLDSLELPPRTAMTIERALTYSSVELFVGSAGSAIHSASLTSVDVALVASICINLGGLPLALELAAAQLPFLGLGGVADKLNSQFVLQTKGRRATIHRQQTLNATLEWSYNLLSLDEQDLLRRLSVFRSHFAVADALGIARQGDQTRTLQLLDGLVQKSMLQIHRDDQSHRFKMLELTRQFALSKAIENGDYRNAASSHASYLFKLLQSLLPVSFAVPEPTMLGKSLLWLDDLRSALDWAFAEGGDEELGLNLTIAATPIWSSAFLQKEGWSRLKQGMYTFNSLSGPHEQRTMSLFATLASRLLFMKTSGAEISAAWKNSFEVAEDLDDVSFRLWPLWGSWLHSYMIGQHKEALQIARSYQTMAVSVESSPDLAIGRLIAGISLFITADPRASIQETNSLVERNAFSTSRVSFMHFQWDPCSVARCYHADALWLLGRTAEALSLAQFNVDEGLASGHAPTVWNALAHGSCPIAIRSGDTQLAESAIARLYDVSRDNALWTAWALAYEGALRISEGHNMEGVATLSRALQLFPQNAFGHRLLGLHCYLAQGYLALGNQAAAKELLNFSIKRARERHDLWCFPELLRLRGHLELQLRGRRNMPRAATMLKVSKRFCQQHGLVGWHSRIDDSFATGNFGNSTSDHPAK